MSSSRLSNSVFALLFTGSVDLGPERDVRTCTPLSSNPGSLDYTLSSNQTAGGNERIPEQTSDPMDESKQIKLSKRRKGTVHTEQKRTTRGAVGDGEPHMSTWCDPNALMGHCNERIRSAILVVAACERDAEADQRIRKH